MSGPRKSPPPRADEPDARNAKNAGNAGNVQDEVPEPVNVVDGIPDRRQRPAVWMYVAIGAAFAAWLAFLIYCAAAGRL